MESRQCCWHLCYIFTLGTNPESYASQKQTAHFFYCLADSCPGPTLSDFPVKSSQQYQPPPPFRKAVRLRCVCAWVCWCMGHVFPLYPDHRATSHFSHCTVTTGYCSIPYTAPRRASAVPQHASIFRAGTRPSVIADMFIESLSDYFNRELYLSDPR